MTISKATCITTPTVPSLAGYTIDPTRAIGARDRGKLLTMRLETCHVCDLNCIYCHNDAGLPAEGELTIPQMQRVLGEAKALGVESVVIIGGGEPLLYPSIKELIRCIGDAGMIPVIITNGQKLTEDLCGFLWKSNASILLKCDSFNREVQDRLAGKAGACDAIIRAIKLLKQIFVQDTTTSILRAGLSFVVTKINRNDILPIWRFCRENSLFPNFEEFIPRGRGLFNRENLHLDDESVHNLKEKLLTFDREQYGYDWILHSPLPGHGCLQPLCSVYITSTGTARPCPDIDVHYSNVKTASLPEIISTPFFRLARSIDKHLAGKCGSCEFVPRCIGCRGNAFTEGINRGMAPEAALCSPDPLCRKLQPVYERSI